jgi:hypothetical protein
MPIAKSTMGETVQAGVGALTASDGRVKFGGVFKVKCFGPDGEKKWETDFHNLVVNEGLQDLNTKYFKASGYTAAWYLGLVTGPGSGTTFAATDTLASHVGWTEDTNYSGSRKAVTFGNATLADPSVIDNSASPAVFNINNTTTVAGAFLASVASGTSGILFSEGDFTGGDKLVANGDTLNVTYTFSADAV